MQHALGKSPSDVDFYQPQTEDALRKPAYRQALREVVMESGVVPGEVEKSPPEQTASNSGSEDAQGSACQGDWMLRFSIAIGEFAAGIGFPVLPAESIGYDL